MTGKETTNFSNHRRKGIMLLILCSIFPLWMTLAGRIGIPDFSAWLVFEYTSWQVLDNMEDKTKQCTKCLEHKQLSEFSKRERSKDGLHTQCKACRSLYKKAYNSTNKAKLATRRHDLSYLYKLTVEQADTILSRSCEICGSNYRKVIDHDHTTGEVRGCLCSTCNMKLGWYENNRDSVNNYLLCRLLPSGGTDVLT
jgi:hypothetical protein